MKNYNYMEKKDHNSFNSSLTVDSVWEKREITKIHYFIKYNN